MDEAKELVRELIRYIPCDTVECRGDKCREPWCISCCGEESAEEGVEYARSLISRARSFLDNE